jgi:hypothetical protein
MAGCGKFLSVALRNRWVAMVFLYVFTAMLMVIPYLSYNTGIDAYDQATHGPGDYALYTFPLYFCPLVSFQEICFDQGTGYSLLAAQRHLMFAGSVPDWIVMVTLYAMLGVVFFALAALTERRLTKTAGAINIAPAV